MEYMLDLFPGSILLTDVKYTEESVHRELVELLGVLRVHGPGLTGVENYSSLDFSVLW